MARIQMRPPSPRRRRMTPSTPTGLTGDAAAAVTPTQPRWLAVAEGPNRLKNRRAAAPSARTLAPCPSARRLGPAARLASHSLGEGGGVRRPPPRASAKRPGGPAESPAKSIGPSAGGICGQEPRRLGRPGPLGPASAPHGGGPAISRGFRVGSPSVCPKAAAACRRSRWVRRRLDPIAAGSRACVARTRRASSC
jgi:hypothetical protein